MARGISRGVIGGPSRTTSLSAAEAVRQYRAEAANWELPAGRQWPDLPFPDRGFDGMGVRYGPGIGRDEARRHWMIAWYHALAESVSTVDRDEALQHLAKRSQVWHRPEVQAAKAGDLSPLRRFLEANRPDDHP